YTHTTPVGPVGAFDNHRMTYAFSYGTVFIHIVAQRAVRTWYARNARFFHRRDCRHFVTHQANSVCFRANEDKAGAFNLLGKVGVLGEEAVTRMDCYCAGDFSGAYDCRDVQITFY